MPYVGFGFDKILAEKTSDLFGKKIQAENSLNIKDVSLDKVALDKKQELIKFKFIFSLNYKPGVGKLSLEGYVLYAESPKKIKEIMKNWKKEKKIPKEMMANLFNTILIKANIKALSVCQDVGLPPHLSLPRLQPKKDVSEYIG